MQRPCSKGTFSIPIHVNAPRGNGVRRRDDGKFTFTLPIQTESGPSDVASPPQTAARVDSSARESCLKMRGLGCRDCTLLFCGAVTLLSLGVIIYLFNRMAAGATPIVEQLLPALSSAGDLVGTLTSGNSVASLLNITNDAARRVVPAADNVVDLLNGSANVVNHLESLLRHPTITISLDPGSRL